MAFFTIWKSSDYFAIWSIKVDATSSADIKA